MKHLQAVLVLDKNPEDLIEHASVCEPLGFRHQFAATGREVVERLRCDESVQILVADMKTIMAERVPLLEEIHRRTAAGRATATIVLTDKITPEVAVKCLHLEATDALTQPLQLEAYTAALSRAAQRVRANQLLLDRAKLADLGDQLARIVNAVEGKTDTLTSPHTPTDDQMRAALRGILSSRTLRHRHFPNDLFADPAWDILLDLTRASLANEQVSVSSVCIAAAVPTSTALRWVSKLTQAGLVRRWTDPKDRRRDHVALTDAAVAHMRTYLWAVYHAVHKL